MHRVVVLKFFGPFIEQAEVGTVAPERPRDAPGKPVPSQDLLGPQDCHLTGTILKLYHPVPVHATVAGC